MHLLILPPYKKGGNIMGNYKIEPQPLTQDQYIEIKKQINKTHLFLITHSCHDPRIVELMKLSALAEVQRKYQTEEPW
jgi:hypothetical protein